MIDTGNPQDIDSYIALFSGETRERLEQMRAAIHEVAPSATETISYQMPTFDMNGKHLVHFAAFAHHIGFYPTPNGIEEFAADLAPYKGGKGSTQFPNDKPLPIDLVKKITLYRVEQLTA